MLLSFRKPGRRIFGAGGLALLLCLLPLLPARAQERQRPLRVATRVIPPFVIQNGDRAGQPPDLTGFSVELWERIAQKMGTGFVWLPPKASVGELLASVRSGEADIGVAAVSITAERVRDFDFSQPILEAGLQIMVRDQSPGASGLLSRLMSVFSPSLIHLLVIVLLFMLIPAHVIWLVERRHAGGLIDAPGYRRGMAKALWWAAATLATQADEMPKTAAGRWVAVIWMFGSVVFVAYFTAQVTTSLTVEQLRSDIRGPDDLPGKRVATTAGSTAAGYLRDRRCQILEFNRIDQAYEALLDRKADAVVFDAPVLLYYAAHEGKGKVEVVGSAFLREGYGIVVPERSPSRKQIDAALLSLRESGDYQRIYDRWFGEKE
jgi:polar amino acid transport system substrate-binding protein